MQGEPINTATRATADFLDRLDPRDRVAVVVFNNEVNQISAVQEVSAVGERLQGQVLGLIADGGTNMNGAVCRATLLMTNRCAVIPQLAKTASTASSCCRMERTRRARFRKPGCSRPACGPAPKAKGRRVFAIAFGNGADQAVLQRLTQETQGALLTATRGCSRSNLSEDFSERWRRLTTRCVSDIAFGCAGQVPCGRRPKRH